MSKDTDKAVMEAAVKVLSTTLDALIAECLAQDGTPQAPSRKTLMKSRGMLPKYCSTSFNATQGVAP
jgi:hypothetical protein